MASDDRELKPRAAAPDATQAGPRDARTAAAEAPPRVDSILVLGMHRAGTSVTARLLGLTGAFIGETDDLLPAHERDNPSGYWERTELVIAHDRVLTASGYAWDHVARYDPRRLDPTAAARLRTEIADVIGRLRTGGTPWLVKDPRLCLLLPLWLDQARDSACVVALRDPQEIVTSLLESHRGVYTSQFLLALWEKYMRTLLAALHGRRALFVSYADLLHDPPTQGARLLNGLRELGVSGLHEAEPAALAEFLDPQLHRSRASPRMALTAAQASLQAWLQAQAEHPGPVPVDGFPQAEAPEWVLSEFQRAMDDRAARAREQTLAETAPRIHEFESRISELESRISEHERSLAILDETRHRLESELSTQRRLTAQAENELSALRPQVISQGEQIEHLRQQLDDTSRHAEGLTTAVEALKSSRSWKITAPLRAVADLLQWRPSARVEQRLFRWYYAMPGISTTRKRSFIVWLHRHAAWLTGQTLSHQIFMRAQQGAVPALRRARPAAVGPRMDGTRAAEIIAGMDAHPLISIVMPVYNVERRWLLAAVDSVRQQFYPHWELCIVDDASTRAETGDALGEIAALDDGRIRIQRLPRNLGIAGASNAALRMATGAYLGLLDNDDALTRDALLEVAQVAVARDPDVIYSDEDKLDTDGSHVEPHFKPDFNIDYFLSINYVCHFAVLRRELVERIGGFRGGFEGAQDYDLLLRATESAQRIEHIQKILYHWRKTETSTALTSGAKPKSWDAGLRALAESVARRSIEAKVEPGPYPNTYRVRRTITSQPLVSILLPFRDKPELLSTCVRSILACTDYPRFEIIGIDNGSVEPTTQALMRDLQRSDQRVRFVRHDAPFNYSRVNNFGASQAQGEHLLLLNNDTEVIRPEWLRAMLEHSQRPEVGVVGAKLRYADDRIQHAGVIVGIGGVAGHAHLLELADRPGYFARAQLAQNLSAVTFACAMTRRDVYTQLGGLNEDDLTIAFNDIDYCLRVREAGYLIVYTPFAELYHYESRTRGYEDNVEKQARFARESLYMQRRHRAILERGDPYYNPNLRLDTNDFSPLPGYVESLPV